MHCAACGTDNDDGSKFCMTCGTALDAGVSPADDQPIPEETPAAVAAGDQVPPPAPEAPADLTPPPAPAWGPPSGEAPPAPPSGPATWQPPSGDTPPPPPADPQAPPAWAASAAAAPPSPSPAPPAWGAPEAGAAPGWGQVAAPAPAWGQPAAPPPAGPPMGHAPPAPAGPPDPNGLGALIGRWSNGSKKQAKTAVAVAGAVLKDGEVVEASVAGRLGGNPAVLTLTDQALVLVDDRQWKPTVERFTVGPDLQVQGWQDDRTASLTILTGGRQLVVDQIGDRPLAVEMAQRIRYRSGG